MHFDRDEIGVALLALRHTRWALKKQIDDRNVVSGCAAAAWFAAKKCEIDIGNLLDRIEQHLKDEGEEKADG